MWIFLIDFSLLGTSPFPALKIYYCPLATYSSGVSAFGDVCHLTSPAFADGLPPLHQWKLFREKIP